MTSTIGGPSAPSPARLASMRRSRYHRAMAKLKVYRTPIGFHDAYVAAPSQKVALQAWGSERDLFARGIAELVTDPALTADALAQPGVVIRRSRGTAAEQIAALPPTPRRRAQAPATADARTAPRDREIPAAKTEPKPDRSPLAAAEQALGDAKARHRSEERALRAEEAALAKRRRGMERDQQDESARLDAERQRAADAYARALKRWRG